MNILITYDVSLLDGDGQKRLRKVAKICRDYGQRVQNSVFELNVNSSQLVLIKKQLLDIIDNQRDSVRIYSLKNVNFVDKLGADNSYSPSDIIII